jgi:hypothetical protein
MKIFFDTEFTGLHKTTTLISIGCVDENGNQFYAELTDYDKSQVNEWIEENVIKNLRLSKNMSSEDMFGNFEICSTKKNVKEALEKWLSKYEEVQFVSDVCHYDFVLLVDIFGNAFDLPKNVSPCCIDLNDYIAKDYDIAEREAFNMSREDILNEWRIEVKGDKHNSLYDAKVIKEIYERLI